MQVGRTWTFGINHVQINAIQKHMLQLQPLWVYEYGIIRGTLLLQQRMLVWCKSPVRSIVSFTIHATMALCCHFQKRLLSTYPCSVSNANLFLSVLYTCFQVVTFVHFVER